MARKFILTLAAAAGCAAFIPAAASADGYGYRCYWYYGAYYCSGSDSDVRADMRDIRRDRNELRWDYWDLRRDLDSGRYGAAQRDIDAIRRDRWELRRDYRELERDLYRRGY
jgi:hypothetical protein